jgi:hypothetical protein
MVDLVAHGAGAARPGGAKRKESSSASSSSGGQRGMGASAEILKSQYILTV